MAGQYGYLKTPVNIPKLELEIIAQSFSQTLTYIQWTDPSLTIQFSGDLTPTEVTTLDTVVANHDGLPLTEYDYFCKNCAYNWQDRNINPPTSCPICSSTEIITQSSIPTDGIIVIKEFNGSGTSGRVKDPGSETGKYLKDDGTWGDPPGNPPPVTTVFTRTGDVVAQTSDYDAEQIDNTPAGNISATNVQDAIDELDDEKLNIDGTKAMTGNLDFDDSYKPINITEPTEPDQAATRNYVIGNSGIPKVKDKDLTIPPLGTNWELYIVGVGASSLWSGHDNELAYYKNGWHFFTPYEGMTVYVADEDRYYFWTGSTWTIINLTYFGSGSATDGQIPKADGSGGIAWEDEGGSKGIIPFPLHCSGGAGYSAEQTIYIGPPGVFAAVASALTRFPAGTIKRITARITTNTTDTNSTIKVYVNSAAQGTGLTFASAETGQKTQTENITISDGDNVCAQVVIGTGGPQDGIYIKEITIEYEPA